MINKLVLTNFQKHEDLTVDFTSGLNAIRGANENGKSSLMRGIAYAFFGSRALPMSLEETVTWGKPVASLKVELTFTHAGNQFTIVRKKSGAELVGDGVTASGQAEATAFIENLFGASAAVAQATMLANQSSLQNGLDSSAMPLIEKLANMSLIDDLIGKVQTKLPSGSTKGVEAQLATVSAAEVPVLETSALEAEIADLRVELVASEQESRNAEYALIQVKALAADGQQKQAANKTAEALKSSLESQVAALRPKLVVPPFEQPDIEALELQVALAAAEAEVAQAWAKFQALPVGPSMLRSDYDSRVNEVSAAVLSANSELSDIRVLNAVAESSKIKESACGLCGKDLSEVPEVVAKNEAADAELARLAALIPQAARKLDAANAELRYLSDFQTRSTKLRSHFPVKFVELAEDFIPPKVMWTGPATSEERSQRDWKAELAAAKAQVLQHSKAVQTAEIAQKQIAELQARLANIEFSELTDAEAQAMLQVGDLKTQAVKAVQAYQAANQALLAAEARLTTAKAVYEANLKAWQAGQEQRAKLVELLSAYHFNNGIIVKLREARPAVAAKLWALVLAGVSHYFSQIRGVSSTVTRGEKGFLIDGKSADAFSGSTRDSLGLAIRLMLQKTFLPNVSFMLADEPGAAFDDVRESDMLAVLAGSGLDQVILVTHSDLADTFAANVITI